MSESALESVVTPRFMDRVADVEQYLSRDDSLKGRAFVAALFDFLYDTVQPFPLAFPVYVLPKHPKLVLRRAVFRRHYSILYEVTSSEVKCLAFFATAQDVGRVDI